MEPVLVICNKEIRITKVDHVIGFFFFFLVHIYLNYAYNTICKENILNSEVCERDEAVQIMYFISEREGWFVGMY